MLSSLFFLSMYYCSFVQRREELLYVPGVLFDVGFSLLILMMRTRTGKRGTAVGSWLVALLVIIFRLSSKSILYFRVSVFARHATPVWWTFSFCDPGGYRDFVSLWGWDEDVSA